eukprot:Anaeramoba_ignava/a217389_174.p1 GENE.a217389_174~~a217389_174.p1  ORF type:complete len:791 (+),score=185.42 a217389_174:13-2385(+)
MSDKENKNKKSNVLQSNEPNFLLEPDFLLDAETPIPNTKDSNLNKNSNTRKENEDEKTSNQKTTRKKSLGIISSESQYQKDLEILERLKKKISTQSRKNFQLEKEIKGLDQKIALLIKNRISLDEIQLEAAENADDLKIISIKDERVREKYSNLFYLLFHEPRYLALVSRYVTPLECEKLLQLIMFTIYGNHYDQREEKLLLLLFEVALHEEFQNCTHTNTLLRANTTITKLLFTYSRRGPGQLYLKKLLSSPLQKIVDDEELNLEINPIRIYEQWINEQESTTGEMTNLKRKLVNEEAAEHPKVIEILAPRIQKLQELFNSLLDLVIEKIDMVPYGIRLICKQIRNLTQEFFPNADKYDSSALIGSFFILRFLNPAIVTPTAYHLVEGKLTPNSRRNLTLLAKILQNLSNMVDSFGKKEAYMAVLRDFMLEQRKKLCDFLERLCRVEDLEIDESLNKFLSLSSESQQIHISLNEIYFVHGLFRKYINDFISDQEDPLKKLLDTMGEEPKQLDRNLCPMIQLALENNLTSPVLQQKNNLNILYKETKEKLATIYQKLLKEFPPDKEVDTAMFIKGLQNLRKEAKVTKDAKINKKIKRILSNMKKLIREKVLSPDDNFKKLRADIETLLLQRDEYHQRILKEFELLESVKENVDLHREYLRKQLDIYREYLENVRRQAYEKQRNNMRGSLRRKNKTIKFSHAEFQKSGVLAESDIPENRQQSVFFKISNTESPGVFGFGLYYQNRPKALYETTINMENLLELQHNSELNLELEYLTLNVNLLIYTIKKNLM